MQKSNYDVIINSLPSCFEKRDNYAYRSFQSLCRWKHFSLVPRPSGIISAGVGINAKGPGYKARQGDQINRGNSATISN